MLCLPPGGRQCGQARPGAHGPPAPFSIPVQIGIYDSQFQKWRMMASYHRGTVYSIGWRKRRAPTKQSAADVIAVDREPGEGAPQKPPAASADQNQLDNAPGQALADQVQLDKAAEQAPGDDGGAGAAEVEGEGEEARPGPAATKRGKKQGLCTRDGRGVAGKGKGSAPEYHGTKWRAFEPLWTWVGMPLVIGHW
jgi:hypothetical protein